MLRTLYSASLILVIGTMIGCVTETLPRHATEAKPGFWSDPLTNTKVAAQKAIQELSPEKTEIHKPWVWNAGIPGSIPRAELLRPVATRSMLASLVPDIKQPEIATVAVNGNDELALIKFDETPVQNCGQLHALVEQAIVKGKDARLSWQSNNSKEVTIAETSVKTLTAVCHAACPDAIYRLAEDGNVCTVMRQGGKYCKVLVRVERERCLLQVVVSIGVCSGSPELLPVEVRATCEGSMPLRCLTAAETLETLYGEINQTTTPIQVESTSFAKVSEREDYLIPTNYKNLEQRLLTSERRSVGPKLQPALASVPGIAYPGTAILGDSRALGAFLGQRSYMQAGEPEKTSWIMFGGASLSKARNLELAVDLGQGPSRLMFRLPE